mmetsp:Transcript_123959/g.277054  ORF Transcript_123959/g.277054 Transcript_123959/m.277054 type:complete len:193 (-) Transcript_123959:516-1094(-)
MPARGDGASLKSPDEPNEEAAARRRPGVDAARGGGPQRARAGPGEAQEEVAGGGGNQLPLLSVPGCSGSIFSLPRGEGQKELEAGGLLSEAAARGHWDEEASTCRSSADGDEATAGGGKEVNGGAPAATGETLPLRPRPFSGLRLRQRLRLPALPPLRQAPVPGSRAEPMRTASPASGAASCTLRGPQQSSS